MSFCRYCKAEVEAPSDLCPNCGASLAQAPPTTLLGSPIADTLIAAFGSLLFGGGLLFGGIMLSEQGRQWTVPVAFGLVVALGLAGIFGVRRRSPSFLRGLIIGLCLLLFNPLTLCLGILFIGGALGG